MGFRCVMCFARCSSWLGLASPAVTVMLSDSFVPHAAADAQWLKSLPVQKANGEELEGPEQAVRTSSAAYLAAFPCFCCC